MPGYQFSHWEANGLISDTTSAIFLDTLNTNSVIFTAHFISTVLEISNTSILVYPNPTEDLLHIRGLSENLDGEMSIYNPLGQLMFTSNSSKEINVASLANGWYILKLTQGEKTYTVKFIKV
jgi:hypothetical protein